jgi:predicted nucleotidyltransferase component of viral defense system
MSLSDAYRAQVALLVAVLPFVAREEIFALKGGTAINLFVRNMPRLSVDIDLTYLPVEPREQSLAAIDAGMRRIGRSIETGLAGAHVTPARTGDHQPVTRLLVRRGRAQIKIEVTPVLRGCVYAPEWRRVSPIVEDGFGFAEIQLVSFADLYAGKAIAALDRQHPRDLFDIRDLLAHEGIDDTLRSAFLIYLISHDRPISEIVAPRRKDLKREFTTGFVGMSDPSVSLDELLAAREELINCMIGAMPQNHRRFLVDFKRGSPDWEAINLSAAASLPAVKWKQTNLDRLAQEARAKLVSRLEQILFPHSLTPEFPLNP